MKFELNTQLKPDGQLDLTLILHDSISRTGRVIAREVANLKDNAVREALIRMGWTPPLDRKTATAAKQAAKQTETIAERFRAEIAHHEEAAIGAASQNRSYAEGYHTGCAHTYGQIVRTMTAIQHTNDLADQLEAASFGAAVDTTTSEEPT